ncbi:uncharacterized mitochondrial protein AtMg00810-like [Lotus japonicus]|uniref:uncharacterized mitochondrial protein AtMg00810-like n=1 Tax=Lotus japonicus TaxID=34305 RepID=UPI0025911F45|nr:uncharacterized mitochondrial protein AtMg00810-like [Lotus japonicus]
MEDSMFISQSKYAKGLVKKFGLEKSSHKKTLAATHVKLTKDGQGEDVDQSLYRSMIGSLLYLTTSRPDITFAVGVCARYQSAPKASHLLQVKRIIKYINSTSDYGILYTHDTNSSLVGYCDVDWAGDVIEQKCPQLNEMPGKNNMNRVENVIANLTALMAQQVTNTTTRD